MMFVNHIKIKSGFSVSTEVFFKWFKEKKKLDYMKMIKKSALKSDYNLQKMQWASKHMSYEHKWCTVIFSVVKKA